MFVPPLPPISTHCGAKIGGAFVLWSDISGGSGDEQKPPKIMKKAESFSLELLLADFVALSCGI